MKPKNTLLHGHSTVRRAHESAPDNPSQSDARRTRLKLVDEYETEGLMESESFEVTMAVVQADLFRTACVTEDSANQAFVGHTVIEHVADSELELHRHLGVVRRIIRNAQQIVRACSAR